MGQAERDYQLLHKTIAHNIIFIIVSTQAQEDFRCKQIHLGQISPGSSLPSQMVPTKPHTKGCLALVSSPSRSSLVTRYSWMFVSRLSKQPPHLHPLCYSHTDAEARAGFSLFGLKHCNLFIWSYVSPDFKHRNAERR